MPVLTTIVDTFYSSGHVKPGLIPQDVLKNMDAQLVYNVRIQFDASKIAKIEKSRRKAILSHVGGYVRKIAVNSIKTRRYKSAPAGHPPYSHDNRGPGGTTYKKSFMYEADAQSVAVGPWADWRDFNSKHEFGGKAQVRREPPKKLMDKIKIGRVGVISSHTNKTAKAYTGRSTAFKWMTRYTDPRTGAALIRTRLKSNRMVENAKRVYRSLYRTYGPGRATTATYAARPVMGPTLKRAQPRIAGFWKDAIGG